MAVVFTGRGEDAQGQFHTRPAFWEPMARSAGYRVDEKVTRSSDILVSSRMDTKKADQARRMGATVMTYPEFQIHCINNEIAGLPSRSQPSTRTIPSAMPDPEPEKAPTNAIDAEHAKRAISWED